MERNYGQEAAYTIKTTAGNVFSGQVASNNSA
ncbi:hypothetical protein H8B15_09300 [Hymenobacter sp. BT507]|uniref:Uncharacterized protein n=1 Tax=Hymenobacter citatus TaxID=2763506 RepID=A0ABR7MJ54_9BACT|nr:hypothetical protein [Hymenobacter citatus]